MNRPILEVNLESLIHNLNYFRSNMRFETKMMVMIKSNAYGAGSIEVAKALEKEHVDYFGVARTEEGIALRRAGILTPIMVMLPDDERYEALSKYHLEAEIYSISQLSKIAAILLPIKIHLKLNTGMHRSGMEAFDIPIIQKILADHTLLNVKSVFSHLSSSSISEYDSHTRNQVRNFQKMSGQLGIQVMQHIVNSNGILRFPQYHFDMVRLGIGIYGSGVKNAPLKTVNTLKATVLQVRMVSPPETIGYNRKGQLTRPSLIALLNIGYGDGLNRLLGNGAYSFLIKGKLAKTVGDICMDITMIDVTNIPVQEGDEVIIFGEGLPVEALSEITETIPYEVFTNISTRVQRKYI